MVHSDRSLEVEISDLRRRVGTQRAVVRSGRVGELVVGSTHLPAEALVTLALELESIPAGIAVHGRLEADWVGACRRCLEEVTGRLDSTVDEVFAAGPDSEEHYGFQGDVLDLISLARDCVLLDLPTAPVCTSDCAGPEPDLFPVTVEDDSDVGSERPRDPRWDALDVLLEPPAAD